uniref:hypothetical protein n=1 Tax=Streptomyces tubercidicus TaxID=47759 RepID=UPI0037DCF4BD|nr:hypothetical protein OG690_38330 [Streptomyces tubercidicus]
MALTIDWTEHDNRTPREQYDQAGAIIDEAKAAAAARRARIAHDLMQESGAQEAASLLGVSDKRIYQLATRYRQSQPVVASNNPGRLIYNYDLLDQVIEQTNMDKREAHDSIHALLDQLVEIDGEAAVVIHQEPVQPELLKSNPSDLDIYYWVTIRQEAADLILEQLAAQHATD